VQTASGLFDLAGKVALVTGSSRGIGRAIATRLAEQGARVVVSSRKVDACEATVADINATFGPGHAIAVAANISRKDDLQRLVEATRRALGRIDILVSNAATNVHFGPMAEITDEAFRKIFENNVLSTHWLVGMVSPEMIARREGVIIIVSSIGALRGSATLGAYNISKTADLQLARNLAVELGPYNIRTNCIVPGLIRTEFSRALWDNPENLAAALRGLPLGRIGEADDIAGAAVFLASPAGRYVNGEAIVVDGGLTVTAGGI
jgi:NAD(P)-dependent dehydrogenase (short-subunit alcohol dehydrogenase family)